jgi:hypothetical protein
MRLLASAPRRKTGKMSVIGHSENLYFFCNYYIPVFSCSFRKMSRIADSVASLSYLTSDEEIPVVPAVKLVFFS